MAKPVKIHLFAVLGTNKASDGAEVVEVCAVQHPEQRLLRPAPLNHAAGLLLPVIIRWTQLCGGLTARIPLCFTHTQKYVLVTLISLGGKVLVTHTHRHVTAHVSVLSHISFALKH